MSGFTPKTFFEHYYDPQNIIDTYYSFGPDADFHEDAFMQPLKRMHNYFSTGACKGDTLLEIGSGPVIHQLILASENFKEIILSDYLQKNIDELQKWLQKQPGAHDWSEVAKLACEMEGHRDTYTEKEEKIRSKVSKVLKCDATEKNPLAPEVLPPVDCIYMSIVLEAICLDKESYCKALKNVSSLLKVGGHLVMLVLVECTFMLCGSFKFPILCIDEEFVRKALTDRGYVIEQLHINPRFDQKKFSVKDFSGIMFVVACKKTDAE